jgi:hypothetical protein
VNADRYFRIRNVCPLSMARAVNALPMSSARNC